MPTLPFDCRAVLCDMDGTLLDTERRSWKAWQRAASELAIDMPLERYQALIGRNRVDGDAILKDICGGDSGQAQELRRRCEIYYDEAIQDTATLAKPGVSELLAFLRDQPVPLAVVTSSSHGVAERKLTATGLRPHFEIIIGGDQVTQGKPAPEPFRTAAQRLGAPIEHCLVLEDSRAGLMSGLAAGATVIALPDMQELPDDLLAQAIAVLPDASALREWLRTNVRFVAPAEQRAS